MKKEQGDSPFGHVADGNLGGLCILLISRNKIEFTVNSPILMLTEIFANRFRKVCIQIINNASSAMKKRFFFHICRKLAHQRSSFRERRVLRRQLVNSTKKNLIFRAHSKADGSVVPAFPRIFYNALLNRCRCDRRKEGGKIVSFFCCIWIFSNEIIADKGLISTAGANPILILMRYFFFTTAYFALYSQSTLKPTHSREPFITGRCRASVNAAACCASLRLLALQKNATLALGRF